MDNIQAAKLCKMVSDLADYLADKIQDKNSEEFKNLESIYDEAILLKLQIENGEDSFGRK